MTVLFFSKNLCYGLGNSNNNTIINKKKQKKKKKNDITMITMNVRTMVKLKPTYKGKSKRPVDKLPFLIEEFNQFNVQIMACQEVRWLNSGQGERGNVTYFHSGDKRIHRNGVAI